MNYTVYNASSEEIDLFRKCYRQIAKIHVSGIEGLSEITEADILQGGLSVDRYCFSSNTLEIGTAIASELSIELDNHTGKFDSVKFDGAILTARIGIKKWDARAWEHAIIHYIPLGVFVVDEKTKNKSSITLSALDNMVKFDKTYDTNLSFPATLGDILQDACTKCGVIQGTTAFPNSTYSVSTKPTDDGLTYRQVVQWIAELAGANAWIDWEGHLRLSWFSDSGMTITGNDRYDSDVEENSVTITGVRVAVSEDDYYEAGSSGCVMNIEGNSLVQSNAESLATSIYSIVGGFTYLPYSCSTRPFPFLFPMDKIQYVDGKGISHSTIVSAITYTMNGTTDISGEGDGETKGGYASTGATTQQEKVIIEKAKAEAEKVSGNQYNVLLDLNQSIGSAFGLYRTEVTENGATIYYLHDKENLEDSTIIYVANAGGFAWTDDWNNGNPIWNYGFTQDGNAVYKILQAYKIQADYLDAGCITADKIGAGEITADKIHAGAIGGFTIDDTHIGKDMTSYNDTEHDGVFMSPDGIGLGKGKFYVTKEGAVHAESGEFSGNIVGGSINIHDNFIVDANGSVTLNGGITWGTGASPTQVVYARTFIIKPADNSKWNDFPVSSTTDWHKTYSNSDYYASYTYDGGKTWTNSIQVVGHNGTNGTNGKDGTDGTDGEDGSTVEVIYLYYRKSSSSAPTTPSYDGGSLPSGWTLSPSGVTSYCLYEFISQATITDGVYSAWSTPVIWAKYGVNGSNGSDATVTDQNVFNALTNNGTMYGCFTALDNKLYINAAYIQAGTLSSDYTFTGSLVATNITASGGQISNLYITGRLYFGGDTQYYVDANYNDSTYYLNLPGLKIDNASGAVFNGSITAKAGTIGNSIYNWTIGASNNTATMYCGLSSIPEIPIGTSSNRAYFGTDGLSYTGDSVYANNFGYTTVIKSGFMACSGDQNGRGLCFRTVKYGCSNIEFYYSGSSNPINGDLGDMQGSIGVNNGGTFQLIYSHIISAKELLPQGTGQVDIGSASYKWNDIYAVNATIQTSDENEKHDMQPIPCAYDTMFDNLSPILFKLNSGTSNRFHTGFGVQTVMSALEKSNLTTQDFAGVCISTVTDDSGEKRTMYGLRYGEFIALCVDQIQKLKARVSELEAVTGGDSNG